MVKHLKSLDDIEDVSIEISFPKDSLYSDYQSPTTASVLITPKPYSDFSENKNKVKGIVNLVAYGIPNLKPENIVVVDDKGNVLSDLLVPDEGSMPLNLQGNTLKSRKGSRRSSFPR